MLLHNSFPAVISATLLLMALVALAQPFATNVPTLTVHSYIDPLSMGRKALVGVVRTTEGWAFTATSDGVYGMNATLTSYSPQSVQFFDSLYGVTQMFATGPRSVVVIARTQVVLYEHNATTAWRAAVQNPLTQVFDVQQLGSGGTSYLYPLVQRSTIVVGTQNVQPSYNPNTTVYAFNSTTLDVLWTTTIPSATTSYAPASYPGDPYVFVLAQSNETSNFIVYKLRLDNGMIVGTPLDTQSSSFTTIGVTDTQLVVLTSNCIDIYDMSWTKLRSTVPIANATNMLYQPAAVNGTWYILVDQQLYAFDYATSAQLSWSPWNFADSVLGATMRPFAKSATTGMSLLMMEGCNVWVLNATGLPLKVMELESQSPCNPVAASHHYDSTATSNNIAYLSYGDNGNGGTVLIFDYLAGHVIGQAAVNLNPVGEAQFDLSSNRLYIANLKDAILQGYALVPPNATGFAAAISIQKTLPFGFGFAYNESSGMSYYIAPSNLYTVDHNGNVEMVAWIPVPAVSVDNNPLIVGQFFVFVSVFEGSYTLHVYNAVNNVFTSVGVCPIAKKYAMFSVGMVVYGVCASETYAAVSVDVSKATLMPVFFGSSNGFGVAANAQQVFISELNTITMYNISASSEPTVVWEVPVYYSVSCAPVLHGDSVYIVVQKNASEGAFGLLQIDINSGAITTFVPVYPYSEYTIRIMEGGVFGSSGYLYFIGTEHVHALDLGTNEIVFTYHLNLGYGTMVLDSRSPTILSTGAMVYFTSTWNLQVVDGLKGRFLWMYTGARTSGAATTHFPITTDGKSVYFVRENEVVGADLHTGAVTSVTAFGMNNNLYGYTILAGEQQTSIVGSNGNMVYTAVTPW